MKSFNQFSLDIKSAQNHCLLENSDPVALGKSLKAMLLDAQDQGRLTFGIYECGMLMEMNPDGIMLCILPENTASDVTLHIHFTLIEAFCWENGIRVIKVDCVDKMKQVLSKGACESRMSLDNEGLDYNCVLVEYPTEKCSSAEENLLDFYKTACAMVPQPVIPLDVS